HISLFESRARPDTGAWRASAIWLIGRDLSIVLAAIGQPRVVLRPFVHATAQRTYGRRDHDRKLLHVGDFDAGRDRISLARAPDHDHSHDPLLSIPVFGPTPPQWLVATVTPQINSPREGRHR